jgi:hypothetical protein
VSSEKKTKRQPFVVKYLEQIALTGLFGPTPTDVVEHFVLEGARRELRRGSASRSVQDGADGAAFAQLCQKYARPVR